MEQIEKMDGEAGGSMKIARDLKELEQEALKRLGKYYGLSKVRRAGAGPPQSFPPFASDGDPRIEHFNTASVLIAEGNRRADLEASERELAALKEKMRTSRRR